MSVEVDDARRQWLSELYSANSAAVFKQCRRMLKDPEEAADATQEIFLRAATALSESVRGAEAGAWLNTVTRNYCIDLIRRRKRFGSAMTTLAATSDAPAESVESVDDRQLLLAVLPRLSPRERRALWQSAVEDLPLAEIARSLGISYLAAAQLLHRARRRALAVATRLAIILGLARLGRVARRSRLLQNTQQLAAVVVLPVAMGLIIVSSAAPMAPTRAHAQSPPLRTANRPPPAILKPAPPINGTLPATGPPPVAARLPATAVLARPPSATTVKSPAPAAPVKPMPPPTPADRDKDHGKGRDRDDATHPHGGGHGK